jgi:diaminopimelate epimerase
MVAATAVVRQLGLVGDQVDVDVAGGRARVEIEPETTWLTGPARTVFTGVIDLPTGIE